MKKYNVTDDVKKIVNSIKKQKVIDDEINKAIDDAIAYNIIFSHGLKRKNKYSFIDLLVLSLGYFAIAMLITVVILAWVS